MCGTREREHTTIDCSNARWIASKFCSNKKLTLDNAWCDCASGVTERILPFQDGIRAAVASPEAQCPSTRTATILDALAAFGHTTGGDAFVVDTLDAAQPVANCNGNKFKKRKQNGGPSHNKTHVQFETFTVTPNILNRFPPEPRILWVAAVRIWPTLLSVSSGQTAGTNHKSGNKMG